MNLGPLGLIGSEVRSGVLAGGGAVGDSLVHGCNMLLRCLLLRVQVPSLTNTSVDGDGDGDRDREIERYRTAVSDPKPKLRFNAAQPQGVWPAIY